MPMALATVLLRGLLLVCEMGLQVVGPVHKEVGGVWNVHTAVPSQVSTPMI